MKPVKRNIVEGVAHMGQYYGALPAIADYIGATYLKEELDEAYEKFIDASLTVPDAHLTSEQSKGIYWNNWILKGRLLNFVIFFEQTEMLYFWHIRCPDEETYLQVRVFMESLFKQ